MGLGVWGYALGFGVWVWGLFLGLGGGCIRAEGFEDATAGVKEVRGWHVPPDANSPE